MVDETDDPLGIIWSRLRADLDDELPATQRVWLAQSRPVALVENTAIVAVRDEFTRTQLETRLRSRIEEELSTALDRTVGLAITVNPELPLDEGGRAAANEPGAGSAQSTGDGEAAVHQFGGWGYSEGQGGVLRRALTCAL